LIVYGGIEAMVDNEIPSAGSADSQDVRSFFPETWLWEIDIIGYKKLISVFSTFRKIIAILLHIDVWSDVLA
jgi:hypothetical protein